MIVTFKQQTLETKKPQFSIVDHEISEDLYGLEGPVIFVKRLSPERIIAATSKLVYLIQVGRGLKITKTIERPRGAVYIDATPKRIVFGTPNEVIVTDLDGNKLFSIPLRIPALAVAAYREYIGVAHENQIDVYADEIKVSSIELYNPTVLRIIKHRRRGMLVAGSSSGRLLLYDLSTKRFRTYKMLNEPVKHIAALSDGHTITAVASSETDVSIIRVMGFTPYSRRSFSVSRVDSLAIGNDGVYVGSGEFVSIFSFGGSRIRSFQAHVSRVSSMDVRPILVTGSELGGIAVRDMGVKRLGKHVVHLSSASTLFGYVNDGRLFRTSDGRVRRMRVGIVRSLDISPGRMGVFATDKDVREVTGTRTRYVAEEPYEIVSVSRTTIALSKDNKVLVNYRNRKETLEFPDKVRGLKVYDLVDKTYLSVASDKVYVYELPRKRIALTIEERAKDLDMTAIYGVPILAILGERVKLRDVKNKRVLATFMRTGKKVRLIRSSNRLFLVIIGDKVHVWDVTDVNRAGEAIISLEASDAAAHPKGLAIGTYGLKIASYKGSKESTIRASRGIEADFKLEGFTDISAFLENPGKELLKAMREGTLGELINTLVDRGIARVVGTIVIIDLEPKETEGLQRIYR